MLGAKTSPDRCEVARGGHVGILFSGPRRGRRCKPGEVGVGPRQNFHRAVWQSELPDHPQSDLMTHRGGVDSGRASSVEAR